MSATPFCKQTFLNALDIAAAIPYRRLTNLKRVLSEVTTKKVKWDLFVPSSEVSVLLISSGNINTADLLAVAFIHLQFRKMYI